MGTRGYRIYRHKGLYFYQYNHYDSYPSGLGLKVLATVPRNDPDSYAMYLKDTREWLDKLLEQKEQREKSGGGDDKADTEEPWSIQTYSPIDDIFIEWTYTIDLDYEVFHVDSYPLFQLSRLPSDEEFESLIGFDSYGHRAYRRNMPSSYRYNWTPPPPTVPSAILQRYQASGAMARDIHQVLGVPERLSNAEAARKDVYQIIIGSFMHLATVGKMLRELEKVKHPSQHRPNTWFEHACRILLSIPIGPMLLDPTTEVVKQEKETVDTLIEKRRRYLERFSGEDKMTQDVLKRWSEEAPDKFPVNVDRDEWVVKAMWLHSRLCVQLATHLNEQDNLHAAVVSIQNTILKNPITKNCPGVYFGVAFSFFHCSIISVDTTHTDRPSIVHTPVLQFLPDYYATSPETPGIAALTRLGFHVSFKAPLPRTTPQGDPPSNSPSSSITRELPLEVWERIVVYMVEKRALISLAGVSRISREAVNRTLRWPRIKNYCILSGVTAISIEKNWQNPITSITLTSIDLTFDILPTGRCSVPERLDSQYQLNGGDFFAELISEQKASIRWPRYYLLRFADQERNERYVVEQGCVDFTKDLYGVGGGDVKKILPPQGCWKLSWSVYEGLRCPGAK